MLNPFLNNIILADYSTQSTENEEKVTKFSIYSWKIVRNRVLL